MMNSNDMVNIEFFRMTSNDELQLVNIEFFFIDCEQRNWFRAEIKFYLFNHINVFEVVLFKNNFVYIEIQDTTYSPSPSPLTQVFIEQRIYRLHQLLSNLCRK